MQLQERLSALMASNAAAVGASDLRIKDTRPRSDQGPGKQQRAEQRVVVSGACVCVSLWLRA